MQLTLILLLTALAGPATAPAPQSVARLAWLAGCWASLDGEPGTGEQWMPPAGGSLIGASRTVRKSRTVGYEFMLIRETEAGGIEFVAQPSGQAEASFPAVSLAEKSVIFENPTHDFPQRIIYRLDDEGILRARIEGKQQGQSKGIDYPMQRVDCPSPASPARR